MRSLLCALLFVSTTAFSQNLTTEINDQIWKPFIKGFTELDAELFMGLHSKDLTRSPRDANQAFGWDEYYRQTKRGNDLTRKNKTKIDIELRFIERIAQGDRAVETGIYKTTYTELSGKSMSIYGKFLVILRKENGKWKILVDTDSSENGSVSEKDFMAAKPMQ